MDINEQTKLQQQSSLDNQPQSMPKDNRQSIVKGKLTLDESTIALLSKYYQGERLAQIKRQMKTILDLINVNVNRYNYSKDYKEAIDHVIALLTAGRFL